MSSRILLSSQSWQIDRRGLTHPRRAPPGRHPSLPAAKRTTTVPSKQIANEQANVDEHIDGGVDVEALDRLHARVPVGSVAALDPRLFASLSDI